MPALPKELAEPSDSELLDWPRSRVNRLMLEEIAGNDRRQEATEHLAGILAQLRANPPLGLLPWNPREVLELERWSEPDKPGSDRPAAGPRGHLKRLMACTLLLRNVGHTSVGDRLHDGDYFVGSSTPTVIQLVRSAVALEGDAPKFAAKLLLWVTMRNHTPRFDRLPLLASRSLPRTSVPASWPTSTLPAFARGSSLSRSRVAQSLAVMLHQTAGFSE